jgi:hypothetical protein
MAVSLMQRRRQARSSGVLKLRPILQEREGVFPGGRQRSRIAAQSSGWQAKSPSAKKNEKYSQKRLALHCVVKIIIVLLTATM